MQLANSTLQLEQILSANLDQDEQDWLMAKIEQIIAEQSAKDLYMTYSLIATRIKSDNKLNFTSDKGDLQLYLEVQAANIQEIARIYLLSKVTEVGPEYFMPKVANIIQVADKNEHATFLKYLILLPNSENYLSVAVDAIRTNIVTVFDAIALNNPYPGQFFSDDQWNQMYLKAAFIERDLGKIMHIDERANKELSHIISDYAHERWAASREIEPRIWRPVGPFIDDRLLKDMTHLAKSDNAIENRVAALCCSVSDNTEAKTLLNENIELKNQIDNKKLSWENLKD